MSEEKKLLVDANEFPSNSQKEKTVKKKVEKVVTGNVKTKKKTLSKKFVETFLDDDLPNVKSYILHDVIVPSIKKTIYEMITGGASMSLFGSTRTNNMRRDGKSSYVAYNSSLYNRSGPQSDRDRSSRRDLSGRNRANHNFDDVVLETRGEAEEVLGALVELVDVYNIASIADLYALVDIKPNFTDEKYGWDNLSSASVTRVKDGYILNLPRTIVIN